MGAALAAALVWDAMARLPVVPVVLSAWRASPLPLAFPVIVFFSVSLGLRQGMKRSVIRLLALQQAW